MQLSAEQVAWGFDGQAVICIALPPSTDEVMPGISWGRADELFTPAFWKYQARLQRSRNRYVEHRLGNSLLHEVSACLLGGYGLPAEIGLAAFERLRLAGVLEGHASAAEIEQLLAMPFAFYGQPRRYRFARQKARYLASALRAVRELSTPSCARSLRDVLMQLDGIGPKTASWIVRNHLTSDEVAILDVHVVRAGIEIGIFDSEANPTRNYFNLEARFLQFCCALEERASQLDAMMWDYMRRVGPTARRSGIAHQLPN